MISAALALAFAPPQTIYTTVEGAAVGAPMWSLAGAADPHAPHVLSFFLKQRNTAALKAALDGVSDPASPDYGKHWSRAAVTALVRPSHAAIDAVVAWLAAEGLRGELSPTGEVLHVRCTLGRAASLLRAPAYERHCTAAGRSCAVRTAGPYSLPATIAPRAPLAAPDHRLGRGRRREVLARAELVGRRPRRVAPGVGRRRVLPHPPRRAGVRHRAAGRRPPRKVSEEVEGGLFWYVEVGGRGGD